MVHIELTVGELEGRWKELLVLSSVRKKDLDENYKLSLKFFKGAEDLLKMLDEAEQNLKNEEPIGVDPAHLRTQLKKHKVCHLFPNSLFIYFLCYCMSLVNPSSLPPHFWRLRCLKFLHTRFLSFQVVRR